MRWCYDHFAPDEIKLSSSFLAEDVVLIHMLSTMVQNPRIFTIDTGRIFQETYDVWNKIIQTYKIKIETFFPDAEDVSKMVSDKGPNLFYDSVENRKTCCHVRKVKPLRNALNDARLWIAGLRRSQSDSRRETPVFAYIEEHNVYKVCPLVSWNEENVWQFIRNNNIPYHTLYDKGFATIGCQPCTRAIGRMEDIRAGRWWWEEETEKKECGIHFENGVLVRG